MSKKKKNNKYTGQLSQKRPESFHSFSKCVKVLKKSVYLIARGRKSKNNKEIITWSTLGSGFVAAPNRFITAAHVVNNPKNGGITQHQDGDKYYLLRHDDANKWHLYIFEPKINKDIFLFPEVDLSIIYISDDFYHLKDKIFADKNDFIRIYKDFLPIGSEIGVLGYPLCKLDFTDHDIRKPKIGNVLLRTDKGVINCRYNKAKAKSMYEFTLSFNPGNSGGPIFDIKTGKLISIVSGYKSFPINQKEVEIPEKFRKTLRMYQNKSYIETIHAIYSIGIATPSFIDILNKHNISD
jgi:hypothetical protein